jgi:hypothetical protein
MGQGRQSATSDVYAGRPVPVGPRRPTAPAGRAQDRRWKLNPGQLARSTGHPEVDPTFYAGRMTDTYACPECSGFGYHEGDDDSGGEMCNLCHGTGTVAEAEYESHRALVQSQRDQAQ